MEKVDTPPLEGLSETGNVHSGEHTYKQRLTGTTFTMVNVLFTIVNTYPDHKKGLKIMADLDFAKRLGRLKSGDSRTKTVGARLSRSEERELIAAANRGGRNVSEWCREALLREARRSKTDPILTEIIANRMLLINVLRPLIAGQKMSGERFDELLTAIKAGKRNAAQEVLEQYAVELPQEATDGE